MLPFGEDEATHQVPSWPQLRDLVVTAEETGLDSIYGADHVIFHGDRTEGIREGWTALTAVAAVTSRVEVGPLVLAAPFRNPALTAKMAVELDEVSGGRLVLGLGCGWHEPEFRDFDFPFDHRVGRFEEALQIILPAPPRGPGPLRGTLASRRHGVAAPPTAARRPADPDRRQGPPDAAARGPPCGSVERGLVRAAGGSPGPRRSRLAAARRVRG